MSGFKAFLLRGNLVELAVAFIMAASFAVVVATFTDVLLGFVSRIFGGNPNFDTITVWDGIPVGRFLTAAVSFVILAFVVYFFVVTPYTKAKEKFFPTPEPEGTPEDVALLTEIRDALVARGGGASPTT